MVNLNDAIKLCDHEKPLLCYIYYVNGVDSQFCVKIPKVSLPWQQGLISKNFISAPYREDMFQIWWRSDRSINLATILSADIGHHRRPRIETGRTSAWLYILSNAAMHALDGQLYQIKISGPNPTKPISNNRSDPRILGWTRPNTTRPKQKACSPCALSISQNVDYCSVSLYICTLDVKINTNMRQESEHHKHYKRSSVTL